MASPDHRLSEFGKQTNLWMNGAMPLTLPRPCPIADTLVLVGDRWSLLVLREALLGVHRFADIAANTGMPRDVLTRRLRALEDSGVLERRRYEQRPERFEYHLTEAGRELETILIGLREWGLRYLPGPTASPPRSAARSAPRSTHTCRHGGPAVVICADCGEPLPTLIAGDHAPGRGGAL